MSFLSALKEKRASLSHTCTKVTTVEGRTLIEEVVNGENVIKECEERNTFCHGFVVDPTPDLQVAEIITSSLYLGSQDVTQDQNLLREYCITHIISLGVPVPLPSQLPNLEYSFLPVLDLPDENLESLLHRALPLIDKIVCRGGCVYVHCNAGVSRAPTVIIAYLMAHRGLTFTEASSLVKEKRPASQPNAGFELQLLEFEAKLNADKT